MDWLTFFISLAVLVFLLDFDLFFGVVFSFIITLLISAVDITQTTTDEIAADLDKIKTQLQDGIDNRNKDDDDFPPAKPEHVKSISTRKYDDVTRVYISNSKRSSDIVQMKTLAGKTYACNDDDTCITEPTMKRHIDNVLFACDPDVCYVVK